MHNIQNNYINLNERDLYSKELTTHRIGFICYDFNIDILLFTFICVIFVQTFPIRVQGCFMKICFKVKCRANTA